MSRRIPFKRLARSVQTLAPPAVTPPPVEPTTDSEPAELAREMGRALADELARYRQAPPDTSSYPDPSKPPPPEYIEAILNRPAERVSFFDLQRLAEVDEATAAARWEEIKRTAREQLDQGWRAGRALESLGGNAWDRVEFHAVRTRLRDAWPPRHVGESLLLDEMAQYEFLRQKWIAVLAVHSKKPALPNRSERSDAEPRRVTAVEATAEAMRMIERLQRLFQNALRLLIKSQGERPARRIDWYGALVGSRKDDK